MSSAADLDPYLGKILLGRYRCLERIGEGATSHVYRVQHAKLGHALALGEHVAPGLQDLVQQCGSVHVALLEIGIAPRPEPLPLPGYDSIDRRQRWWLQPIFDYSVSHRSGLGAFNITGCQVQPASVTARIGA